VSLPVLVGDFALCIFSNFFFTLFYRCICAIVILLMNLGR